MNYGIIDLGSNSVRLEIYSFQKDEMKHVYSRREVLGLASYVLPEGYLSDLGIDALIRVLNELVQSSKHFDLKALYVVATATIRNARNQNEVLIKIKKNCGVNVIVLDEEKEAYYGYKGVTLKFDIKDGLVVDIGGGSTEVTLVKNGLVKEGHSLPIGSLNAYISYVKDVLPSLDEKARILHAVINALKQENVIKEQVLEVYGIGGTIRACKVLIESLLNKKIDFLTKSHLEDLMKRLNPLKKQTYLSLMRMIPDRTHTIIPGMMILLALMEYFEFSQLKVSDYGIREGYLFERVEN